VQPGFGRQSAAEGVSGAKPIASNPIVPDYSIMYFMRRRGYLVENFPAVLPHIALNCVNFF
jgi:hypothetical protein